jgi:cytochrome P450 PksS
VADTGVVDSQDQFKIFSRASRANPQAIYARMREEAPVHCVVGPATGGHYWFITRYQDCVTALKEPSIGKEFRKKLPPDLLQYYRQSDGADAAANMMTNNMLFVDPPDHTRLRGLVHKAFTPKIIENLRPRIQTIADDLLDQMGDSGETDLISSFAFPLPITVIAELLGIPSSDQNQFRDWIRAMIFSRDQDVVRTAGMEFVMYFHGMFDDRRKNPREDLLSNLVAVEEAGDKLDGQELMGMIFLLLIAGHETTVNLIANGTLALLQNRDQLEKLVNDPSLAGNAVEEILRYNGPIETATTRWAFEGIKVGGHELTLGDMVLIALASANRDPDVFPNPDQFDITRKEAFKHLGFGNGIHYCLGAPLARLEGELALNALVQRLPHLELSVPVEDLEWNESILLHGMTKMPIRY